MQEKMSSDWQAKASDWVQKQKQDDAMFEQIRLIVAQHNIDIVLFLANVSASICGINTEDFFRKQKSKECVKHARWFFWHTYRTMTQETYIKIKQVSAQIGLNYSVDGIRKAVEWMEQMVRKELKWKRRWIEMQKVINILMEQE